MTPQQLIDLPGYGSAEKQLRKDGLWVIDPQDRIERALASIDEAIDDMRTAQYTIGHEMEKLNEIHN